MNRLGVGVALLLVLGAAAVSGYAWHSLSDVKMSTGGYVALILGSSATLGLAAALIGLLFYSNAKGFDDDAGGHLIDDEDSHR